VHGDWWVNARVERFVEAALLQVLAEGPTHGYELADAIEQIAPGERVDLGNLYRLLRSLEEEGVVHSEWRDDLGGPAKRTYDLTDDGALLLTAWAASLADLQITLAGFRRRHGTTAEEEPR
jgi:PadR family transcriptional regulator, regulatory protein PadR